MKNKNFLIKADSMKLQVSDPIEIERNLLSRLNLMGIVLAFLTVFTFIFALMVEEDLQATSLSLQTGFPILEKIEESSGLSLLIQEGELEIDPMEILNFYMVSALFAAVGASCFFIVWQKKRVLGKK